MYIIANLEVITDKEKFRDYERGLVKSLGRHGGEHSYSEKLVIFSFPLLMRGGLKDYQAASDIRRKYSVTNFIAQLEELPTRN